MLIAVPTAAADRPVSGPDFDADGYADLVVAAPKENLPHVTGAGVVHVLYGTADGVSAARNQTWSQDTAGLAGEAERYDYFGEALGWGDFNADGFDDLVVGAPMEDGTRQSSGAVHVIYGSVIGLTAEGNQLWDQDVEGVNGGAERFDYFGSALAADDFDGDGFDDLAVGVPGESTPLRSGVVQVMRGSTTGLTATGNTTWRQPVGTPGKYDGFGRSIAAGDLDGDGHPDLVVGALNRSIPGVERAGTVSVFYGTVDGLGTARAQEWSKASPGVPGRARRADRFGSSLAIGDLDGDGYDDLAVGSPQDVARGTRLYGSANVLFGGPTGLASARAQRWTQATPGVPGRPGVDDRVAAVSVTDIDADGYPELVLGIPGEVFDGQSRTDKILVLPGTDAGPVAEGAKRWGQNSRGVEDQTETLDEFGTALSSADFDADGFLDVAIGVPGEKLTEDGGHAGAVTLLYGGPAGLSGDGDQLWSQGAGGVGERAEDHDRFGSVLAAG